MRVCALLLLSAAAVMPVQAAPPQDEAVKVLSAELKAHVPANWQIRVRWRDGQLLASVTPWPYQEAFNLWYEPQKLGEALLGLCPKPDDEIWKLTSQSRRVRHCSAHSR